MLFTACSKMKMAEKTSLAAFLTMSPEMWAKLRFAVVLLALRSRAAFCPGTGRGAGVPSGTLHQNRQYPIPAAGGARPAPVPDPAAPHAFPLLAGGLAGCSHGFAPARPAHPFCQLGAVVRMATGMKAHGLRESKERVPGTRRS